MGKTSLFDEKRNYYNLEDKNWPVSSPLVSIIAVGFSWNENVSALLNLTCRRFHWVRFQILERNQKIRVNTNESREWEGIVEQRERIFPHKKENVDWIVQYELNVSPFLFIRRAGYKTVMSVYLQPLHHIYSFSRCFHPNQLTNKQCNNEMTVWSSFGQKA